jgi:hypothetical protein
LPPKNEQILFARRFYDVSAASISCGLLKKTRLKWDFRHFDVVVKLGHLSSNYLTTLLPWSILHSNLIGSYVFCGMIAIMYFGIPLPG